jgi:hypothetical protein
MNILQWHAVCACDDIDEKDVMEFEHDGKICAISIARRPASTRPPASAPG